MNEEMYMIGSAVRWLFRCLIQSITLSALCLPSGQIALGRDDEDFFEKNIRPLLLENCLECHGPDQAEADLRLDSRPAMIAGNDQGPVLVPGQWEQSRIWAVVRPNAEPHMPPEGQLSQQSLEHLQQWIAAGAVWPEANSNLNKQELAATHWAFQPIRRGRENSLAAGENNRVGELSAEAKLLAGDGVASDSSAATVIDDWVQRSQLLNGIVGNDSASPRQLFLRLNYDLLGLPPTWQEWQQFSQLPLPEAWPIWVDKLLARPEFGERWARHWLDVTRYADTKGYVFEDDRNYKTAYLYRDWVIRAFNEDLPFHQFLQRQIAADLDPSVVDRRDQAALGFWTLGRRFLNNPYDIYDDRIDVLMRGTMGLTVSCARCHDHKYDPISMADYYSLVGIVAASAETSLPLSDPTPEFLTELERRRQVLKDYEQGEGKQGRINELRRQISEWENSDQAPLQLLVLAEPSQPPEWPHVLLRGNPDRPDVQVPRQFLRFFSAVDERLYEQGSGRRELAEAITSERNPLTARVWVNRIWAQLFGQGLVTTPSDFGLRSDPPSHPELLDALADELMRSGWSTKHVIRQIVLSQTYRQSSEILEELRQWDPENRWLGRFPRRRLDWESMRDKLLVAAGALDKTLFGPSVDIVQTPTAHRRTLYAFIDRQNLPGVFRTFDFASPDAHSPKRFTTTVPQQALFLMNDPFVIEMARRTADRIAVLAGAEQGGRVPTLYRQLFCREPTEAELQLAHQFLGDLAEPPKSAADETAGQESNASAAEAESARWVQYVQALLMSNEFQFVD